MYGYPLKISTAKSRQPGDTDATYYRVVDDSTGIFNEDGDLLSSSPRLKLIEYPVVRFTPMGASIRTGKDGAKDSRFVSNYTGKRFAWSSKELALADFIKRKTMQARILRKQATRCDELSLMADWELKGLELKRGA